MSAKVKSLTVHKNTQRKRHAKSLVTGVAAHAKEARSHLGDDMAGYAFVAFDARGDKCIAYWDANAASFSARFLPDLVKNAIGMQQMLDAVAYEFDVDD